MTAHLAMQGGTVPRKAFTSQMACVIQVSTVLKKHSLHLRLMERRVKCALKVTTARKVQSIPKTVLPGNTTQVHRNRKQAIALIALQGNIVPEVQMLIQMD